MTLFHTHEDGSDRDDSRNSEEVNMTIMMAVVITAWMLGVTRTSDTVIIQTLAMHGFGVHRPEIHL